jgi:uncharacterized protein (TIGR03089 family)
MSTRTPAVLLAEALAADPSGPLITFYDDATGERIELSATTLDNWVAKTANLLQDGGVEPGSRAAVLLPPHWQSAAILLGCWSAGLSVVVAGMHGADVVFAGPGQLDAALEARADEVYGLSLAPMAPPLRDLPPGVSDYATEVRGHGDRFAPVTPVDPHATAVFGEEGSLSYADLAEAATARAAELEITGADRVLVDAASTHTPEWLLVPLAVGASLVLCRNLDPAKVAERVAAERVTVSLGVTVPDVRRAG